jgi:outer membrane protein OmpA-like peptidoglycan-associated protein
MIRCSRSLDVVSALLLTAALAACATQSGTVVLLPERDGRATAVHVTQGERALVLDQPYAAAEITSSGPRAATVGADEVKAMFGAALDAQPMRPTAFTVYFDEDDALTADSQRLVEDVLAAIARTPVPDVVIVGHTDLVGTDAFNDELARKRAESVRQRLIARGIAPGRIVAYGRGKREPAVPTADGVPEPRNRRVEIIVR